VGTECLCRQFRDLRVRSRQHNTQVVCKPRDFVCVVLSINVDQLVWLQHTAHRRGGSGSRQRKSKEEKEEEKIQTNGHDSTNLVRHTVCSIHQLKDSAIHVIDELGERLPREFTRHSRNLSKKKERKKKKEKKERKKKRKKKKKKKNKIQITQMKYTESNYKIH